MKTSSRQDARPSFQFYPQDWLADLGILTCTLAAQGLWMRMLCWMWCSPKRGSLLKPSGRVMCPVDIARAVSLDEGYVDGLLTELDEAGVSSSDGDGTIYNRRMRREWEAHEKMSEGGRKGGLKRQHGENGKPLEGSRARARSSSSSSSRTKTNRHVVAGAREAPSVEGLPPLTPSVSQFLQTLKENGNNGVCEGVLSALVDYADLDDGIAQRAIAKLASGLRRTPMPNHPVSYVEKLCRIAHQEWLVDTRDVQEAEAMQRARADRDAAVAARTPEDVAAHRARIAGIRERLAGMTGGGE